MSVPVDTVRGPVPTPALGRTLMHEHIFVLNHEVHANYPHLWDESARVADAVDRLNALKAAGIDTLVDLTVLGMGRYLPRIQRIAEQTELNILVATGYYTHNELPNYFRLRGPGTMRGGPEPLDELFIRDIVDGIGETGVRAAVLKGATDHLGITPDVERVLRAVARAHRETGVPISTHSHAGTHRGLEQQDLFASEGVDLRRVVIGHHGDTTDIDYLEEIIARGSYLGMDRFGIDFMLPFDERIDIVARLCERGRHTSLVLSQDAGCHVDWFDDDAMAKALPNWHFLHITQDVVPALRKRGVTEEQLDTMLIDNPRRIFEQQGGY